MSKKILVTGVCKSGTEYINQIFKKCGLKSNREKVFPQYKRYYPEEWAKADVEVSGLAVPHLEKYHILDDTILVHIIRNPLNTCTSWLNLVQKDLVYLHHIYPEEWNFYLSWPDIALSHWVGWNQRIDSLQPNFLFNIEKGLHAQADIINDITEAAGHYGHITARVLKEIPIDLNSTKNMPNAQEQLKWTDFEDRTLQQKAFRYWDMRNAE